MALIRDVTGRDLEPAIPQANGRRLIGDEGSDLPVGAVESREDGLAGVGVGAHHDQWHDLQISVDRELADRTVARSFY